jgi:hypothetical protein
MNYWVGLVLNDVGHIATLQRFLDEGLITHLSYYHDQIPCEHCKKSTKTFLVYDGYAYIIMCFYCIRDTFSQ